MSIKAARAVLTDEHCGLNQRAAMKDQAAIAQLGERQTEDLEVPGSIPGLGILITVSHHLQKAQLGPGPKSSASGN